MLRLHGEAEGPPARLVMQHAPEVDMHVNITGHSLPASTPGPSPACHCDLLIQVAHEAHAVLLCPHEGVQLLHEQAVEVTGVHQVLLQVTRQLTLLAGFLWMEWR